AVTDFAAVMATVHCSPNVPETASQPLQPFRKIVPSAGVAVRVTVVPITYGAEHVAPQLIPDGLDVTVPEPIPVLLTARLNTLRLNVTVTVLAAVIVTVQVEPDTTSQPTQPPTVEFAAGTAVSVTCESLR